STVDCRLSFPCLFCAFTVDCRLSTVDCLSRACSVPLLLTVDCRLSTVFPVLCLFAKDPTRAKTRLAQELGSPAAVRLAEAFLDDTLALLAAPYHVWADGPLPERVALHAPQCPPHLGAPLPHAVSADLAPT